MDNSAIRLGAGDVIIVEMEPEAQKHNWTRVGIPVLALVVIVGFLVYQYYKSVRPSFAPETNTATESAQTTAYTDIGTEAFEKAQNPIADTLPETAATIANPIEGIYKNPFEF